MIVGSRQGMWLVAFQQDNKWIFGLYLVIGDTSIFKIYVVKSVILLVLLKLFLGLLKSKRKDIQNTFKKKYKKSLITWESL